MDLEDFVKASLLQIAKGTAEASKELLAVGHAVVVPTDIRPSGVVTSDGSAGHFVYGEPEPGSEPPDIREHPVQLVQFDVAVVASSEGKSGARLEVAIPAVIKAHVGGGSGSVAETTSRLRFTVPIALTPGAASARKPVQSAAVNIPFGG